MKRIIDRKKTCKNIRAITDRKRISAKEIADRTGVSTDTVKGWIKGEHFPSLNHLYGLSMVLGVSMEDILIKL